jgi:hypothetical protein
MKEPFTHTDLETLGGLHCLLEALYYCRNDSEGGTSHA